MVARLEAFEALTLLLDFVGGKNSPSLGSMPEVKRASCPTKGLLMPTRKNFVRFTQHPKIVVSHRFKGHFSYNPLRYF